MLGREIGDSSAVDHAGDVRRIIERQAWLGDIASKAGHLTHQFAGISANLRIAIDQPKDRMPRIHEAAAELAAEEASGACDQYALPHD